ncbi:IS110 family transposase ISSsu10 [bioreactor metagenome]|uniref:IS110 family transposase ISSsu10 n=1 Tax=bioreactor metagenome TaxID=1076179 RepID=A0A645HID8_9ZZZZ
MRLQTRRRKAYTERIPQCKNEIHNILQRANIKLASYLSDIYGVTGIELLEMFIDGEVITEKTILPKIHRKIKATATELVEAMDGKLSFEVQFLLGQSLEHYRHSVNQVEEITVVIKQYILERFEREYNLLVELPRFSVIVACMILSEVGLNVEDFKSQGNLALWAGVCPGSYESAQIKKSSHTQKRK